MGIRDWLLDYQYNPATDYSGQYGSLFGADTGGDYFYGGPNSNWRHALDDKVKKSRGMVLAGMSYLPATWIVMRLRR